MARLDQLTELYAGFGLKPDLICVRRRDDSQDTLTLLADRVDRFGVVPFSSELGVPSREADITLQAMQTPGGAEGYSVVHLDGVSLARPEGAAGLWVADAFDGQVAMTPDRDLAVAALETVRRDHAWVGYGAVRLPVCCDPVAFAGPPGQMVGWPAALSEASARGFGEVLRVLESRAARLTDGLLVPAKVRVPGALKSNQAIADTDHPSPGMRALGLAVLPGDTLDHHLHDVVSLIRRGRPVLTTPSIAAQFEGRWHLPTADSAEGLAGWIEGWLDGRDVPYFIETAKQTQQVFFDDAVAMTAHAKANFEALLGGKPLVADETDALPA